MRRILVIGSPGAGKSTAARRLAQLLGLPLVHLDREFFGPGWVETPRAEWRRRVSGLVTKPEWVMDGNYRSTLDLRIPRATDIVWLDLPRWRCILNVVRRLLRHYGRVRPDLGPGCVERFDWSFMRWIWIYPKKVRPETARLLRSAGADKRIFVLRSWAELPDLERHLALGREAA